MAIPVIDFSKLNGQDRARTLAQIAHACQEWGFFQVMNHGIGEELLERVKRVSSEFYKLEREENFNNSEVVNLFKETGDEKLENVDWEDVITLADDNQWPFKTPGFQETMKEYRCELKKLAVKIMEVMDDNLGLPKGYIKKAFNGGESESNAFFGTKVSHYPPCPNPEKVTGLRAHTDAGGVILLFQDDEVSGLQVLKDGEWIYVQPLKNTIVINTGDQIEVLSNGRYKSAWHRVLSTVEGNRLSIASFYNPSLEATIAPATQLVKGTKEEMDQTYPKFVFGDYMSVYVQQKFLPKEPRFQAVRTV
ncbi:1-aminocyclopropane-1-carboxylate oxidase 5 [Hibiscus syriacus]|uniref:aminocyclopropanecarboxylate oxidase n=1 Tax=Hibiscus syriacus TaxID=106335 RepID=A0A6A3D0Z7_HIBSY|nr:1-aminocyclopropane-1-carboxylate oxidase 5-like [Hibiscus syriacus]KAE8735116.1 1-aminocyclopropane-1-carboxylate oxidase 5 [Hibiscus syriacus]